MGLYCWRRKNERRIFPSPSKPNFHFAELHIQVKPGLPGLLKSRITVEVNGRQPTFVMIIYVKRPEDAQRLNKPLSACHR